ncbi:MAG TPA: hypothetical protein VGB74_05290 [Actinoplanes sp.]
MELALQDFFASLPQAAAVWMLMVLALALAVAVMALPRSVQVVAPAADELGHAEVDAPAPEYEHLRYVDELTVAAGRAAATATRERAEWEAAQRDLDGAWAAFDAADLAARQTTRATAYPLMSRRRKPGDNVDRERYLHAAATAACRNREISIAQLNDIYAHRGWNPRLHPVVQEAALRNAIREHRLAAYRAAQERERAAWQAAETAAEALRGLRLEATAAVARTGVRQPVSDEQWRAEQWTTGELPAVA